MEERKISMEYLKHQLSPERKKNIMKVVVHINLLRNTGYYISYDEMKVKQDQG